MDFDVIIVGGSYAGLSASLSLGRALRKVLIIDNNKPCNLQTPHSHNFLTHDGEKPSDVSARARAEILKYPTVQFFTGKAIAAKQISGGFNITLESGEVFNARKILLSTGLKDVMPDIRGFDACWAISIIHCPYCHGYEVKNEKIGLLMNGDHAFEMASNLYNWNKDLTILTNGKPQFTDVQLDKLKSKSISVVENEIVEMEHENGHLKNVVFQGGKRLKLKAIYARPEIQQHSNLYQNLGCELTDLKTIKVNDFGKTTIEGVYAAGDCASLFRSLSIVVASGTMAGVALNREMIAEEF